MSEPVAIDDVYVKKATDKALLCVIEEEDHWVPISQVHEDSEVYDEGHKGTLIVTAWFAEKKGWGE